MRLPSFGLWILPLLGILFGGLFSSEVVHSWAGGAWQVGDFWGTIWHPDLHKWGLLPMLLGSAETALLAWGLAFPWALALSIGIVVGPPWMKGARRLLQGLLGIPSLLYGFFSVCTVVQVLRFCGVGSGYSGLAVGMTLAVLILPTLCLGFVEGWRQLPASMWHTTQQLGFTPLQQARALLPALAPSVQRATWLGIGRALGDCMVALFVSGNIPQLSLNPAAGVRTLSAHTALVAGLDPVSPGFASLFGAAIGLALLAWGLPKVADYGRYGISHIWQPFPRIEAALWRGLFWLAPCGLILLWLTVGGYVGAQLVEGLWVTPVAQWVSWWVPFCTSLLLALGTVGIVLPLGTWLAVRISLTSSWSWRWWNETVLRFMASIPSLWIGIAGLLSVIALQQIGYTSIQLCIGVAVLCLSVAALPAMVYTVQAGLAQLPREWQKTGDRLGYSPTWMWWHVVLPHLAPFLRHGALLAAIRALEDTAIGLVTGAVAFASFPLSWHDRFSPLSFHLFFLADQYRNPEERAQLFVMGCLWIGGTWILLGLCRSIAPGCNLNRGTV